MHLNRDVTDYLMGKIMDEIDYEFLTLDSAGVFFHIRCMSVCGAENKLLKGVPCEDEEDQCCWIKFVK